MYTNIPTQDVTLIIQGILQRKGTPAEITQELTWLANIILNQSYFSYNNQCYKQPEGLKIGAPTSAFFQNCTYNTQNTVNEIYNILTKYNILSYSRYVNNILILYENIHTDTDHMLL